MAARKMKAGNFAPFLGPEEERELVRLAGAGDVVAAHRLVVSHFRFVVKIARRFVKSGVPMNDLVQEGMVGLLQAVRRFRPEKNARLATYAAWWIRATIQEHVVKSWSLVRLSTNSAQKSLFLHLRRVTAELVEGADALSDDIVAKLAERFETTAAEVIGLARRIANRDQSLDAPIAGGAGESWIDRLPSQAPTVEERLVEAGEKRLIADLIARALAKLPARERIIIRRRYFNEARQTFASLGRELGLSKDRVRQLEARALNSLANLLEPGLVNRLS